MPPQSISIGSKLPGSNPSKRKLVDEKDFSRCIRHPKLYMEDGTIALLAGNTVFRTYRGLLSMNSEVFSNMCSFSTHQPLDAETYDGCPLVQLSDNPEDLSYFLQALHDFSFFPNTNQSISFGVLAGSLRLATKYMVPRLRQKCIEHLSRALTTDFVSFMRHPDVKCEVFGSKEDVPHPFQVISLLRECNVEKLLPHAFLAACQRGLGALLLGETVGNAVFRLSDEDARIAVLGWESVRKDIFDDLLRLPIGTSKECFQGSCTLGTRSEALNALLKRVNEGCHFSLMIKCGKGGAMCAHCAARWDTLYKTSLSKVWSLLPLYFTLPCWEDLARDPS